MNAIDPSSVLTPAAIAPQGRTATGAGEFAEVLERVTEESSQEPVSRVADDPAPPVTVEDSSIAEEGTQQESEHRRLVESVGEIAAVIPPTTPIIPATGATLQGAAPVTTLAAAPATAESGTSFVPDAQTAPSATATLADALPVADTAAEEPAPVLAPGAADVDGAVPAPELLATDGHAAPALEPTAAAQLGVELLAADDAQPVTEARKAVDSAGGDPLPARDTTTPASVPSAHAAPPAATPDRSLPPVTPTQPQAEIPSAVWDVAKRAALVAPRVVEAVISTEHGNIAISARHALSGVVVTLAGDGANGVDLTSVRSELAGTGIQVSIDARSQAHSGNDRTFTPAQPEPAQPLPSAPDQVRAVENRSAPSAHDRLDVLA